VAATSLDTESCEETESKDRSSGVPLSFGEQLVLDTYFRCRSRPYNRQRQEELAQPRRHQGTLQAHGLHKSHMSQGSVDESTSLWATSSLSTAAPVEGKTNTKLHPKYAQELILRLSTVTPKARIENPPPQTTRTNQIDVNFNLDAMLQRLTTPRPSKMLPALPTTGERTVLLNGQALTERPVDPDRIKYLSKARKRGASCHSWRVHPDRHSSSTTGEKTALLNGQALPERPADPDRTKYLSKVHKHGASCHSWQVD